MGVSLAVRAAKVARCAAVRCRCDRDICGMRYMPEMTIPRAVKLWALRSVVLFLPLLLCASVQAQQEGAPARPTYYNPIEDTTYHASGGFKTYVNGEEVDSLPPSVRETKLEKLVLLSSNADLEESTSVEDLKTIAYRTTEIFMELFGESKKSGKVMVQFELTQEKNEIQFAVRDDLDLELMKTFEKRVQGERFPHAKTVPVKFQLIYKVNDFDDPQ